MYLINLYINVTINQNLVWNWKHRMNYLLISWVTFNQYYSAFRYFGKEYMLHIKFKFNLIANWKRPKNILINHKNEPKLRFCQVYTEWTASI